MRPIAPWLWRKQLRIAIHPDRVCIARTAGNRDRLSDLRSIAVRRGAWPWDLPLEALRRELVDYAEPPLPVDVSLSSHFARHIVVPWREGIANRSGRAEFARHCFRALYGAQVSHWDVGVDDGGRRRNSLAFAVDREWAVGLERVCSAYGLDRVVIRPWFLAACQRFRAEIARDERGCVVVVEPGRATVGTYDRFGWHTLTTCNLADEGPGVLAAVLSQELARSGPREPQEPLFVIRVGSNACTLLRSRVKNWVTGTWRTGRGDN